MRRLEQVGPPHGERIERHKGVDRLFHWVMAASVLVLLVTGVWTQWVDLLRVPVSSFETVI